MENKEKLNVDVFIKYSTNDIDKFKNAVNQGKVIMLREIHIDERFRPKRYVRYYLTFRILQLPEKKPLPQFNITQQKLERLQNAALSLELLEMQLNNLKQQNQELFYFFEVGGIYVSEENEQQKITPWYTL